MGVSRTDPLTALLLRYLATGEAAAMEELVRRTRPLLLRTARSIGVGEEAEDAVQGAYHALLRRGALPAEVPVMGWLVTTVVRIAWKQRARARKIDSLAHQLEVPSEELGPADGAQRTERIALVRAAVTRLPAKYRDPLVLHHLQGVPVADLARLMELPVNTVKTRLRRGRQLLERRLAPLVASLFVVAWSLFDAARPLAATTGGIMKAKTAVGIGLIAFASGAAGFAFGTDQDRASHRALAPNRALVATESRRTAALADVQETPKVRPLPRGSAKPAPNAAFEETLREAAKELGVGEAALQQARFALAAANGLALARRSGSAMADHHLAEVQRAVDDLSERGEEGFRAMQALARCGYSGEFGDLLARLCPPGNERDLVRDAVDTDASVPARMSALDALAHLRTPEVDAALRDLMQRSDNPAIFVRAVRALAPRGLAVDLAPVERALRNEKWRSRHGKLLQSLSEFGGDRGAAMLERFARDPAFAQPGPALAALSRIDPTLARSTATELLDGPRGAELPAMQRARLRVLSGRW
jgi:RNA polymerase sigma factor (sigma-70 family)